VRRAREYSQSRWSHPGCWTPAGPPLRPCFGVSPDTPKEH